MSLDRLKELYGYISKHSNYQKLHPRINSILNLNQQISGKYESERFSFIKNSLPIDDGRFLDIGGNTGYFTFELIDQGAKSVDFYEGNVEHAEFVSLAKNLYHPNCRVSVFPKYFSSELADSHCSEPYDGCLLLNVLHHIGDDFYDEVKNIAIAKTKITKELQSISFKSKKVAFQLGFNWKGDRDKPLFQSGTKSELISFVKEISTDHFDIIKIGIAEKSEFGIQYQDLNDLNINRDNTLGEFLNRPLFVLQSKNI